MIQARPIAYVPPESRLPYVRWAALGLLLAAEGLAFSVHFESGAMPAGARWSVGLIMNLRPLARPAIVAAIAAACLGSRPVLAILIANPERAARGLPWPLLLGQVTLMAAFTALSDALVAGLATSRYADLAVAAWFATGLSALVLWAGCMLPRSLWTPVARALAGPLGCGVVAGLLAMVAGSSTASLWGHLHWSTFRAAFALLGLLFEDRVFDPARFVLGVRDFSVTIAPACSGSEGIGLIWAFLGVYLVLFRRELRFPAALLLLPIGTAVIWGANVLRIVALISIGGAGYPGIAVGGFHSQSGWIAFNLVGLGLVLASRASGLIRRESEAGPGRAGAVAMANPVTPYVMPLTVLVATTMLTSAASAGAGLDLFYPARLVATAATLWCLRSRYRPVAWSGSFSWSAAAIGALVFAAWMALEPAAWAGEGSGATRAELLALPPIASLGWLVARVVGSTVTVPIAEELAFRGFLLRRLVARDFEVVTPRQLTWFSIAASSACFGALHGRWLAGTLAGIAYAAAYRRRGRLGDAIVAHAVTNGLIAGTVLATGRWSLWT